MADVSVVHKQDDTLGDGQSPLRVLATNVETADSELSQMRGLMFRSDIPDDFALVMEVGNSGGLPFLSGPSRQFVHMLFVRFPLDVIWLVEDEVRKAGRLTPWRGMGMARADRILELPAGAAEGVEAGDTVRIVDNEALDASTVTQTKPNNKN